jgi:hypothetical protein
MGRSAASSDGSGWKSPTLLVSPHFDDVVLSASSLLGNPRTTVVTVFAGAPIVPVVAEWDALCGFRDSDEARTKRHLEDDDAFKDLPVHRAHLELLDGQYGPEGRDAAEVVFGDFVRAWLEENPGGLVFVPIAAGSHLNLVDKVRWRIPFRPLGLPRGGPPNPDHVWVRDVARRFLPPGKIAYYRDLPYALSDHRRNEAYGLPNHEVQEVPPAPDKATRVAAYVSQVPHIVPRWNASLDWMLDYTERFWLPKV